MAAAKQPSKTALIETMRMAVGSQFELATVQRTIARNLPLLRGLYRANAKSFSADDIAFLQQARALLGAVDEVIEHQEHWREQTDVDPDTLIDELLQLRQQLGALACVDEVDALVDQVGRRAGLALTAGMLAQRQESLLQDQLPGCPRCAQPMVKRQSQYGEFWGCSRFPQCWGKRAIDENPSAVD